MKFLFVKLQLYVNKYEATCTLPIVQHLLLFFHYLIANICF